MALFSFEVPLRYLKEFDCYQDYYFTLSFLYKRKEYTRHIKEVSKRLVSIILDNSYNELGEPDDPNELARLFYKYDLTAVVAPDSDSWDTEKLKEAFNELSGLVPRPKIWAVVRTGEEFNLFKGQIRCAPYEYRMNPYNEGLFQCRHFLGLVSMEELTYWKPRSVDTSMPLKLALKGMTIQDWKEHDYKHIHTKDIPNFFDLKMTKAEIKLAKENIETIKRIDRGQIFL